MKKKLTIEELEHRRAEVDARPAEKPTEADLAAFAEADAEDPAEAVTLTEYKESREFSGRLLIRVPKELHQSLVEKAKANGVSLNQYALYKLAK